MIENILAKLFEHNHWANLSIIEACSALSDEQLDAEPQTVVKGTVRETLTHLVSSQRGYLALLTRPVEERLHRTPLDYADLPEVARVSGEGLIAFVWDNPEKNLKPQLQTSDGFHVEPWVILVQIINHAHEHREQICSMLNALGVTPPGMDGWSYGEATSAFVPISSH